MSLCVIIGIGVGCWALLSLLSGERFRVEQELKAASIAREKARAEAETVVS